MPFGLTPRDPEPAPGPEAGDLDPFGDTTAADASNDPNPEPAPGPEAGDNQPAEALTAEPDSGSGPRPQNPYEEMFAKLRKRRSGR